jgi:poly-gamma-glutamate capsule biosynthesis protein CapA/YwtB (metallophosphatase superfamily)
MSILIGGDLCPTGSNLPLFEKGDGAALLGECVSEFQKADLSVVNLECPLIREESPIEKEGPILDAPVDCVKGFRAMGIDVVNLGNNHIMDHGSTGLQSTIAALEDNDIAHVGASFRWPNMNSASPARAARGPIRLTSWISCASSSGTVRIGII